MDPLEQLSLHQITEKIRDLASRPEENFAQLGACLSAVKKRKLFHSEYLSFGDYVRAGCPFGWRTANYFMRIAQRLDSNTCTRLGYSRARMVAAIEDEALRHETADAVENLTVREASRFISQLRRQAPRSFSRLTQPSPRQVARAFLTLLSSALGLEAYERRIANLEKHLLRWKRKGIPHAAEILRQLRQGELQRNWQSQIEENQWVLDHLTVGSLGPSTRQALQRILRRRAGLKRDDRQLKLY